VIQYNEAYGTKGQRDGEGFDSDWNSKNTLIQYNYSHDNDGGFLLICNEGRRDPAENAGNTGTIARYNISQNDRTRGITLTGWSGRWESNPPQHTANLLNPLISAARLGSTRVHNRGYFFNCFTVRFTYDVPVNL
jgi:hypothetical protein